MTINFYPKQYQDTGVHPINHNYLPRQFEDMDDIWALVRKVVEKGDFTLGSAVDRFEEKFAKLNGGKYAIGVGSGTDALRLSLKVLGIGPGDEVITTPYTFFATVGAIVTVGAKPVFVDVANDLNIDDSKLEAAITSRTKAIMPVHWSGNPCNMDKIREIASQHKLFVVADACHAICSDYKSEPIGQWADLSCFSMHPLKNLNVWGDGGVILTDNKNYAERLGKLRNHGLINRDECEVFAYNSRLDTIQAVVAEYLIDNKLANITQSRIRNATYLDEKLKNIPGVLIPSRNPDKKHVFHLHIGMYERRDELQLYLNQNGIDAKVHYPIPMHLQPAAKDWGYKEGDFPVAEAICRECLSLPVHEYISSQDLEFMVEKISQFYRDGR